MLIISLLQQITNTNHSSISESDLGTHVREVIGCLLRRARALSTPVSNAHPCGPAIFVELDHTVDLQGASASGPTPVYSTNNAGQKVTTNSKVQYKYNTSDGEVVVRK